LPVLLALLGFILYYFVTSQVRKPVRTYTTTTTQKSKVVRTITKKVIENLGNGCQLVEIDGVIHYDYKGKTLNLARKNDEINENTQAIIINDFEWRTSVEKISLPRELLVLSLIDFNNLYQNEVATQIFLKKLILPNSNIDIFPSSWLKLTNMEDFECTGNKMKELPKELVKWKKLVRLCLNNCQFSEIPIVISSLQTLNVLEFSGNHISETPSVFASLANLETLDLSFNQISILPIEITLLKNLKVLNLSGNQLTNLPLEITSLTNLKVLDLTGNQINVQKFRWLMPIVKILG
jgi:Leucine-rich repeat (LRR) protein